MRLCSTGHTPPPDWSPQTYPCFPLRGVDHRCTAPHTHQDQGPVTSRPPASQLPLAPVVPQKTVSSLPRPIVYGSQMLWLPCGAHGPLAHGRGVARLPTIRLQAICDGWRGGPSKAHGYAPFFLPASPLNPRVARPQPKALWTSQGTRSRIIS